MPKISIITTCYNEKNIQRTCESIANQTFQDFEWIVVDGGSTDETLNILNKYKDRINILISEKDSGPYNAMNKGIKLSNGKWLNFMNGGDTFYSLNVLENIFKDKEYDADILYGNSVFISKEPDLHIPADELRLEELINNPINHQSMFIAKSVFEKYGLYDENYKICADHEKFVMCYINACKLIHINEIVSNYYLNGLSSNNISILKKEIQIILNNVLNNLTNSSNNNDNKYISLYKNNLLKNYYADLEKKKLAEKCKRLSKLNKYTFIEKIFSVKNDYGDKKKYKVICLLGIKFKFKSNKKSF